MFNIICFLVYSTILSYGRVSIINSIKPKTLKSIKIGTAMGSAVGASVPAIKELTDIKKEMVNIKARSDNSVHEFPSSYINHLNSNFHIKTEWNYSTFINDIYNNNIISVSVHQDGKFAYVIENTHLQNHLTSINDIHYITLIPLHVVTLIDILIDNGIPFDIFV